MNPTPTLDYWARLLGGLALEAALVIALAGLLTCLTRAEFWRRMIWRGAFLGILVVTIVELTGLSRIGFRRPPPPPSRATAPVASTPATPPVREAFAPSAVPRPTGATELASRPMTRPPRGSGVWWPGWLWLGGIILLLSRILAAGWVFRRKQTLVPETEALELLHGLAGRMGFGRPVNVVSIRGLETPVAFGVLKPVVAMPANFTRLFTVREQAAVFAHELAHLEAADPAWQLLARVVAAVCWWHPLVWWAQGQMTLATEMAADEASLLVESGPHTLAGCLVRMGRSMTAPPALAWLQASGNGFRSGLGRRVQQLLKLESAPWHPRRSPMTVWAMAGELVLLCGLAVGLPHWLVPWAGGAERDALPSGGSGWRNSILGITLAAVTPDSRPGTTLPSPAASGAPSTAPSVPATSESLRTYRLDRNLLLRALGRLGKTVKESPAGFAIVDPEDAVLVGDFLVSAGICARDSRSYYFNERNMLLCIRASEERLLKMERDLGIRALTGGLVAPFKIKAGPGSGSSPVSSALTNRIYKVDANTFSQALESARGLGPMYERGPADAVDLPTYRMLINMLTDLTGINFGVRPSALTVAVPSSSPEATLGLDVPMGTVPRKTPPESPHRAFYFKDRDGILLVWATAEELGLVEQVLNALTTAPAQINLEARFIEIPETTARSIELLNYHGYRAFGATEEQSRALIVQLTYQTNAGVVAPPGITTLSGRSALFQTILPRSAAFLASHAVASIGEYDGPKVSKFVTRLGSGPGYNKGQPPGQSGAGNTAAMVIDIRSEFTNPIPTSVSMDVIPRVQADDRIHLTIAPSFTETNGYATSSGLTSSPSTVSSDPTRHDSPVLELGMMGSRVMIGSGESAICGPFRFEFIRNPAGEDPGSPQTTGGQSGHSPAPSREMMARFVIVTATLIDAAGNRIK